MKQAGQITRPILESFQRWLWRYTKPNGQRLGWSTQRNRLGILKDFFRWLTRQNVILHNPASELELPRMEKRLPQEALSLARSGTASGRARRGRPFGHPRPGHAGTLLLDAECAGPSFAAWNWPTCNTERRTVHVRQGKGKKDRMVPVGQRAAQWVERYLQETRPRLCLDTRTQALFLTGYGGPFNPTFSAAW